MDHWAPVRNYRGSYEACDGGYVRSIQRAVPGKNGSMRMLKGQQLSPRRKGSKGVLMVNLWRHNTCQQVPVKRLVLESFREARPHYHDAVCVNGDESDCRLINLAWEPLGGLAALRAALMSRRS